MSSTRTRRPRARRGEGDQLRREILDAAEHLLVERGDIDAVSIRAVCAAVGVSQPSVYMHFADKTDLIFAVCNRRFAKLAEDMKSAELDAADPLDALRRRSHAYLSFGLTHPEEYRVLFMSRPWSRPGTHAPERYTAQDLSRQQFEAVRRCINAGVLPPNTNPTLVASGLTIVTHGVTSMLIAKPQFPWPDPEALLDHLLDAYLTGLG
jgi:AcrR family transcriptional regulator